jgi:hypothetical protein
MTDKLERIYKDAVVAYSMCYSGICIEGLTARDIRTDVSQVRFKLSTSRTLRAGAKYAAL